VEETGPTLCLGSSPGRTRRRATLCRREGIRLSSSLPPRLSPRQHCTPCRRNPPNSVNGLGRPDRGCWWGFLGERLARRHSVASIPRAWAACGSSWRWSSFAVVMRRPAASGESFLRSPPGRLGRPRIHPPPADWAGRTQGATPFDDHALAGTARWVAPCIEDTSVRTENGRFRAGHSREPTLLDDCIGDRDRAALEDDWGYLCATSVKTLARRGLCTGIRAMTGAVGSGSCKPIRSRARCFAARALRRLTTSRPWV